MTTSKTGLQQLAKAAMDVPLETSRQYAERLLTDGKFAMLEKKSHPELVQAARRDQIKLKLRDPNQHEIGQALRQSWDKEARDAGSLSAAQVTALSDFPTKAAIQSIPADVVVKMKNSDQASEREKYNRYRLASATLGVIDPALVAKLNTPDTVEANEVLQQIPTAAAEKLNLDPTLRLSKVGMNKVMEQFANKVIEEVKAATEGAE
jgi:hypothetical protein